MTKRQYLLVSAFLLFLLCYVSMVLSQSGGQTIRWTQVPIRSSAQKKMGLLGGEGMQAIMGIAYAPSNPQIAYLVSDTSQVWKSSDGGNTWYMQHNGFYALGGLSVVIDPYNEDIAFVAGSTGKTYEKASKLPDPFGGIFRTVDGGKTWELVRRVDFFKTVIGGKRLVFDPRSFDGVKTKTIYAGTYREGLLKSIDAGNTWITLGLQDVSIHDVKIHPKRPSTLFLATMGGLFKYEDDKCKISKIGSGLPDYPGTIAVNPNKPDVIYAAVGKHGVYRSIDGGNNFVSRNRGLPRKDCTNISLSPSQPDFLYVSMHRTTLLNPYWSHDGGATWHFPKTLDRGKLSLVGEHRFIGGPIEPHPNKPNIALATANGKARMIKTEDAGITWTYSGNGYTGGRKGVGKTSQAFFAKPHQMIFFLIDHGPALTEDGGDTFRLLPIPRVLRRKTTPVGAVQPLDNANVIVTAIGQWSKQLLVVSKDKGNSWKIFQGTEDNYRFIAFHSQKPHIVYAQGFISEDTGNSWRALSEKVRAVYSANGDIVYSIGKFKKDMSVIKRSTDRGRTWQIPFDPLPIGPRAINEIDVDPTNPDRIYVASNKGFYIFNHKKKNWIKKGDKSGLMKDHFGLMAFKCVAVDPRHPEVVYTGKCAPGKGHSNGIFRSTDYGASWQNITYNLGPDITVWSISVSPHDGTVYLGSSHGTWKLTPPY